MIYVFSILLLVLLFGKNGGDDSNSIAINPERLQLLKEALGWMTFRKNGMLMEEPDVESLLLDKLTQKYITSKFYRTFVIAFQQGVLPGLILQEGDPCDPEYTFEYKDPLNSSVTWHYQKKFTFKSYDDRMSGKGGEYCDYRQGLKCIPSTRKCECPEGSTMQPISPSSQLRRCLMEKDEICALIDIDHGKDPSHSALASNMYHLIFNLEKPLSCKDGTQCRFKDINTKYPFCYDINNGPWLPTRIDFPNGHSWISFSLKFVSECAIGLYATPGSCEGKTLGKAHVCYNFGPSRSIKGQDPENRTGFCYDEWGIYGLTDRGSLTHSLFFRPYFVAFVHPRTVPLRGSELEKFYDRYTPRLTNSFTFHGNIRVEAEEEGDKCNVGKTQKMEQAWKYFASLEADPPPGKDYVTAATKTELFANLDTVEKEVANRTDADRKVCTVYWTIQIEYWGNRKNLPALTCVPDNSTDADGNDGTCKLAGTETRELAERIERFQSIADSIYSELKNEEWNYRKVILLENPEPECLPSFGLLPPLQFRHQRQSDIPETLKGGYYCPNGSVCYQDFSDELGIYDDGCNINTDAKIHLVCQNTTQSLEKCENQLLEDKLNQVLRKLDKYEKLGIGQSCFYNLELTLRKDVNAVHYFNKYEALAWIERRICDRKWKHLECTEKGTCECMDGYKCDELLTEPTPDNYGHSTTNEFPFPKSNGRSVKQHVEKPVALVIIVITMTTGMITTL